MGSGVLGAVQAICAIFAAASATRAFTFIADKRHAEAPAWLFGTFLPLGIFAVTWAALGDATVSALARNLILGFVGAAAGASMFIWIGYMIQPTIKAKELNMKQDNSSEVRGAVPPVTITGGDNVVSVGQIGGITARVVNINPPSSPEFRILSKEMNTLADGSQQIRLKAHVVSPVTPGLLALTIRAQGLRQVTVMPPPSDGFSSMMMRNVIKSDNSFSTEIPSPRGYYDLVITTSTAAEISIEANF